MLSLGVLLHYSLSLLFLVNYLICSSVGREYASVRWSKTRKRREIFTVWHWIRLLEAVWVGLTSTNHACVKLLVKTYIVYSDEEMIDHLEYFNWIIRSGVKEGKFLPRLCCSTLTHQFKFDVQKSCVCELILNSQNLVKYLLPEPWQP
jgi:hypothetical protein